MRLTAKEMMQGERCDRTEQGVLQQRECERGAGQNQIGVTATGSHS